MKLQLLNEHEFVIDDLSQFDAAAIMHSGQVFRYMPTVDGFDLWSGNHWAKLKLKPDHVIVECDDVNYFRNYFDCDTDYLQIKNSLTFSKLNKTIANGGGIRILRGDFIEMVISFIISANNNIKRFSQTLSSLCEKYGTQIPNHGYAFPTLAQLQKITQSQWRALGVGYRDVHLVRAIAELSTWNLTEIQKLPTKELNIKLQTLAGVGPKVAACIMLFACHRYEVVPVDTWIKKALSQFSVAEQKAIFTHPYAGVLQQYIFYNLQYLHNKI